MRSDDDLRKVLHDIRQEVDDARQVDAINGCEHVVKYDDCFLRVVPLSQRKPDTKTERV